MQNREKTFWLYLLNLVWEIGWIIVLPILIFILGGIYLDKTLHTQPVFILIGFILAGVSSAFLVYRKIKPFLR